MKVGVCLGGDGSRGYAHIGAIRALWDYFIISKDNIRQGIFLALFIYKLISLIYLKVTSNECVEQEIHGS